MDWLDRFTKKFGQWYRTASGITDETELTPKDVLHKILEAMEEGRSEGLDGRIYVPNRYILELAVMNSEERAYLLSFLDEEELVSVLELHMQHKDYLTRGPLDFTIEELEAYPGEEKLFVRALFDKTVASRQVKPKTGQPADREVTMMSATPPTPDMPDDRIVDDLTVEIHAIDGLDEPETVHSAPTAWAALLVEGPDGSRSLVSINKEIFTLGRSRHANNDLVLSNDGQVSKRHIRIELERDGGATLYDLASTNGTCINGRLVPVNATLHHGDVIEIGQTRMEFQRAADGEAAHHQHQPLERTILASSLPAVVRGQSAAPAVAESAPALADLKPRLTKVGDGQQSVLGSETLVGRGMTCDIVLTEQTVSTQQARIHANFGARYTLQDLSGRGTTIVNGRPTRTGERVPLNAGDRISLGGVAFIFSVE